MKREHINRVVHEADLPALREMLDPPALRSESRGQQLRGLAQTVSFTLQVSTQYRCWVPEPGGTERNPTSLRTSDGRRIWIRSRYWSPSRFDYHEFVSWVPDADVQAPEADVGLPWEAGLPEFTRDGRVRLGDVNHLLTNPERWTEVGLLPQQVPPRLRPAVHAMRAALADEPTLAAPYWHLESDRPCLVGPLTLGGPDSTVAAVMVANGGAYDLFTVLPRHKAYWNVLTVGVTPPDWLGVTSGVHCDKSTDVSVRPPVLPSTLHSRRTLPGSPRSGVSPVSLAA